MWWCIDLVAWHIVIDDDLVVFGAITQGAILQISWNNRDDTGLCSKSTYSSWALACLTGRTILKMPFCLVTTSSWLSSTFSAPSSMRSAVGSTGSAISAKLFVKRRSIHAPVSWRKDCGLQKSSAVIATYSRPSLTQTSKPVFQPTPASGRWCVPWQSRQQQVPLKGWQHQLQAIYSSLL